MEPTYIPLRVHSAYSMLEGAMHPGDIALACRKAGIPAAALTDRNNLFGAMEFGDAMAGLGIQPIIGVTLNVLRPHDLGGVGDLYDALVLLAKDATGYANLIALVSHAHLVAESPAPPHIALADLAGRAEGLIALTGAHEGALTRLLAAGQSAHGMGYLDRLQALFSDRLYIELSRLGYPDEALAEEALIALALERGLPLVATNAVLFDKADAHEAHDALTCIATGAYVSQQERSRRSAEHRFKSPSEMGRLFADVPEALANTVVIARRCAFKAPSRNPILPSFGDSAAEEALLRSKAGAGLDSRLEQSGQGAVDAAPYRERLDYELGIIVQMGFAGYFLIVSDFIQWAKGQGIPVGPGRGSGAGSLVAWALRITDLDPLRLGLLFERFLNPERVSMPDFDIDFCETRREEVIRYVQEKYGRDHVAQIITFGSLKARAVIKDVGRVLQMPYAQVDRLSKLIPNNPANPLTLAQAIASEEKLRAERREDPDVAHLLDVALKLEGLYRHASTHAAGVVIGDRPLDQLVPLYRDPRSDMAVTQFDMKWVEKAGLVKFDFLGLKTLSVLQRAVDLLAKRGVSLDLQAVPWDDEATYALLARGDTVGVFQLESEGMRRTLAMLKPDTFGDIVALVALYRPGPMDNIPSFTNRKHGTEAIDYLHPWLEPILKETYGVIIYQEQVMQIAQVLAGYSLGEADLLRRAMGKKKKEEMDAQKARFLQGAVEKGVPGDRAAFIFELVAKFAGYGFNKSHAAAYALIAYHTAWLKANYPTEFYAASMSYDITNTDKLAVFVEDMRRLGIALLPPDVNAAEADFSVEEGAVRYALAALKGVGEGAMEALVAERKAHGPFRSLGDLATRLDPRQINRRQLESMASAGVFDALEPSRAVALALVEPILAHAAASAEARGSAQVSLFGDDQSRPATLPIPQVEAQSLSQRMDGEREAFGFFFSAHPLDAYQSVLTQRKVMSIAQAQALSPEGADRRSVTIAGLIEEARWRTPQPSGAQNGRSRAPRRYLLLKLSDASGSCFASCFDEEVQGAAERAAEASPAVVVSAELMWRPGDETPRFTVRSLSALDTITAQAAQFMDILVDGPADLKAICAILDRQKGGRGQVRLSLMLDRNREAVLRLPGTFKLDDAVAQAVRGHTSVLDARIASSR